VTVQSLVAQATWHPQSMHSLPDWSCKSQLALPTLGKVIKSTLLSVTKTTIMLY